jgi:hypothetical protein
LRVVTTLCAAESLACQLNLLHKKLSIIRMTLAVDLLLINFSLSSRYSEGTSQYARCNVNSAYLSSRERFLVFFSSLVKFARPPYLVCFISVKCCVVKRLSIELASLACVRYSSSVVTSTGATGSSYDEAASGCERAP